MEEESTCNNNTDIAEIVHNNGEIDVAEAKSKCKAARVASGHPTCRAIITSDAAIAEDSKSSPEDLPSSFHKYPELNTIPHGVDFIEFFYETFAIGVGRRAIHAVSWIADNVLV